MSHPVNHHRIIRRPSWAWTGKEERRVATHNRVHQLIRSISAQQTVISSREISLTWAKRNRNDICMTRRDPERWSRIIYGGGVSSRPTPMYDKGICHRTAFAFDYRYTTATIDRCDRADTPIGIYDRSFPTSVRVSSSSTFHPSPFHRFTTLARFHFFIRFFFLNFFSARYRPRVSKRFFIRCHASFMNLVWPRYEFLLRFLISFFFGFLSDSLLLPFLFLLIFIRTKVKKQINLFASIYLILIHIHSKRNLDNGDYFIHDWFNLIRFISLYIIFKDQKIKILKFLWYRSRKGDCNYLEHFSHPQTIKNLRIFSVIKHQSTPSSFRNFTLKFQHFPPRRLKSYFTAPLPPSRPRSNPSPRVHPSPLSRIHLHPPILFDPSPLPYPWKPIKVIRSYG